MNKENKEQTSAVTKNDIIMESSKAVHGQLDLYREVVLKGLREDPIFLAHLISYNRKKSQLRDPKIAFPVLTASYSGQLEDEVLENAFAHLMLLTPKELVKAYNYVLDMRPQVKTFNGVSSVQTYEGMRPRMTRTKNLVKGYLKKIENLPVEKREKVALQFRNYLKTLYSLVHLKPSDYMDVALFGYSTKHTKIVLPPDSVFVLLKNLNNMSPVEAAGYIAKYKIPFLVARTACASHWENDTFVMTMIERMTPTEFITNATPLIKKRGVKVSGALRSAYNDALKKASLTSKNVFKTTKAIEEMAEAALDESMAESLTVIQEKQFAVAQQKYGVDGNWVILGDKSASQEQSIDLTKQLAASMARLVKGEVKIFFFNNPDDCAYYDATGKTLQDILAATRHVHAQGATSIGSGLDMARLYPMDIDGIAIVSDGMENTAPFFTDVYAQLCKKQGKTIPVYLYKTQATMHGWQDRELETSMKDREFSMKVFDLRSQNVIDYTNLPSLINTMRSNQYSLVQEIMDTPLLTMKDVM